MDYQVWTKEEYGETYAKVDCGDLAAAKREIDQAYKRGLEPLLTVEVPYSLAIKVEPVGTEKPQRRAAKKETETTVEEESKSEASQSKTPASEGPRLEGEGEI